jgi:hypothetical protein
MGKTDITFIGINVQVGCIGGNDFEAMTPADAGIKVLLGGRKR